MVIKLVSCANVNGFQYYDVHLVIDGKEFVICPVLYSTANYRWFVKLPTYPLFETGLYSELINHLCYIVRELF